MSDYKTPLKDINKIDKNIKIVFITSEFNRDYTSRLEALNEHFLKENGFSNIERYNVPGAFEIPAFTKKIIEIKKPDLIICLGVVVRGETTHYDMVAGESARGIMNISIESKTAMINGILTCENFEQVEARVNYSAAVSGLNLLSELVKIRG
ncbi:MAG: 6,7-dimethyl-8-ribityllumazine synthase [Candidatus Gracilibacteria bacterium]|nr:6,7-dimethyl-8-ribityllumazine synthase [Candidatus Gracilibacteria bacterium]